MIKILHGADFHLDSPFEALPPEKAMAQRALQRKLLDDLILLAEKKAVDVILLAGDILDSETSYFETGTALVSAFSKTDIPIFIAPGNHDYYHRRSPWAALSLPENVHVFDKNEIEAFEIPEKNLVVWGGAFTQNYSENILANFTAPAQDNNTHVMVLHGDVGGFEHYNPLSVDDLKNTGMHYIALGHKHAYSGLLKAGDVPYAYSGCLQGRGFDEQGDCGLIFAEVGKYQARIDFYPVNSRAYHHIEVDASGVPNIADAIMQALPKNAKDCICRVVLKGQAEEIVNERVLLEQLADSCFHLEIRNQLSLRRDIWAAAEEDSLRGLFLRKMKLRYEASQDAAEQRQLALAITAGLNAMDKSEQMGGN